MNRPTELVQLALARLRRLMRQFNSRSHRERLMVFAAVVSLAGMLADSLWLEPVLKEWRTSRARQLQARASLQQRQTETARFHQEGAQLNQQIQAEIRQLRQRVGQNAAAIQDIQGRLVSARQMLALLDQVLATHGGLKVRALQSLPKVDLVAATTPAGGQAASSLLYRHGVELVVEGSFADLLSYMQALERMPQRLLWGGMQLQVEQHPRVVLKLRAYTLGMDRSWLEI